MWTARVFRQRVNASANAARNARHVRDLRLGVPARGRDVHRDVRAVEREARDERVEREHDDVVDELEEEPQREPVGAALRRELADVEKLGRVVVLAHGRVRREEEEEPDDGHRDVRRGSHRRDEDLLRVRAAAAGGDGEPAERPFRSGLAGSPEARTGNYGIAL